MSLREAAQQALEALEVWRDCLTDPRAKPGWRFAVVGEKAMNTLRASLAGEAMQRLTAVQQEMESVTDCHDLKKARATVIENLLAHFGITSANSDVNLAYLHKQLEEFLAASIRCNKDGDKLTPRLKEVEECSYPNCLSTDGCETQCPAFPRLKDSHIGDATKMMATSQESRQVEPVGYGVFEDGNLHDSFRLEHEAKLFAALKGEHAEVGALYRSPPTINEMETVEPVAWMCSDESLCRSGYERFSRVCASAWNIPVYTAPPKRKPLTDEKIMEIFINSGRCKNTFARAIERAHGIGGEE